MGAQMCTNRRCGCVQSKQITLYLRFELASCHYFYFPSGIFFFPQLSCTVIEIWFISRHFGWHHKNLAFEQSCVDFWHPLSIRVYFSSICLTWAYFMIGVFFFFPQMIALQTHQEHFIPANVPQIPFPPPPHLKLTKYTFFNHLLFSRRHQR